MKKIIEFLDSTEKKVFFEEKDLEKKMPGLKKWLETGKTPNWAKLTNHNVFLDFLSLFERQLDAANFLGCSPQKISLLKKGMRSLQASDLDKIKNHLERKK